MRLSESSYQPRHVNPRIQVTTIPKYLGEFVQTYPLESPLITFCSEKNGHSLRGSKEI